MIKKVCLRKTFMFIAWIVFFNMPIRLSSQKITVRIGANQAVCSIAGTGEKVMEASISTDTILYNIINDVCEFAKFENCMQFIIMSATVPNVQAHKDSLGRFCISYNQDYLQRIVSGKLHIWAHRLIFAHEIWHHTGAHLDKQANKDRMREQEFEADRFAGRFMAYKRAEESDIIAIVNSILPINSDDVHGSRKQRLDSIITSFRKEKIKIANNEITTGTIGFKNLTNSTIRVFQLVDNFWIDYNTKIEIAPNQATKMTNLKFGEAIFYIEKLNGKSNWSPKWQHYKNEPHKVSIDPDPKPIDIK